MSGQSVCVRFSQSARCKNTQERKQHELQEAEERAWELIQTMILKIVANFYATVNDEKKTVNNDVSCPGSCSTQQPFWPKMEEPSKQGSMCHSSMLARSLSICCYDWQPSFPVPF
jgi:hypothetical protein